LKLRFHTASGAWEGGLVKIDSTQRKQRIDFMRSQAGAWEREFVRRSLGTRVCKEELEREFVRRTCK